MLGSLDPAFMNVTVTIEDAGYCKKTFRFPPHINLKRVLDRYRAFVCPDCSTTSLLTFWFEATKIVAGHTAKSLGMRTGDVIDVRIADQFARGACPLPSEQTVPNLHYIAEAPCVSEDVIRQLLVQPSGVERITIQMNEDGGLHMVFRIKVSSTLKLAMQAFAAQAHRELDTCRFLVDGERVQGYQTPAQLKKQLLGGFEDGDIIEVHREGISGGGPA